MNRKPCRKELAAMRRPKKMKWRERVAIEMAKPKPTMKQLIGNLI